ncbi:serine/threonine-protein kinase [Modestobacter sp. VKM Ac-2985]|uniref:serine/threonine-protein kinase n=1 Tax=Modestobacter sp. VKM Ac-2985 TaxID=3004139 RepID=UPI0022ABA7C9|nr:serine/threonine-protein kinase [Modestobacter sp. VKM Ac-2985]MCZ2836097.1 serine/threonine-protein kinase [Modestobacter sp. VKM Ac-2985]
MTAPGARVAGRYLLESRLGGGAMGAVWLARDELLGREVAVKQVLIPFGSDPEATAGHREAAMREGRIAARLTHPHAIAVYDMVDDGGTPWLVMEHLPSRSLASVLAERGTLPVQQVALIGAQVADALVATHAVGVVHRDVKPGNILIGEGPRSAGLVKITDFGISRARGDVSLTQTGVVKGTPAYLAPEVARGQEPREASDVFSLGATLHACLEGTPPFGMTENPLEMLHRVAGGNVARPRNAGPLTRPLMRMLANDPAKRPTMAQARDQLAKLAAGRDGDTTEVLAARTPLLPTLADLRAVPGATTTGATDAPASTDSPTTGSATADSSTDSSTTGSATGAPTTGSATGAPTTGSATGSPTTGTPAGAAAAEPALPADAPPSPEARARPGTGDQPADTDRPEDAGATPPAAAAAGAPPAAGRPPSPTPRPGRSRRSRLVAAAAIVFLALSGTLGAVWFGTRDDDDRVPAAEAGSSPSAPSSADPAPSSAAPTPTPTPTTEEEPVVTSETPAPTSAVPTPSVTPPPTAPTAAPTLTPTPTPAGPAPGSAAEVVQAVTSYYALLPGDAGAAWERTGPRLRAEIGSRAAYLAFWDRFQSVSRGPVSAQDGSLVASVPVTFTERNGTVSAEQHQVTLVRGDDGRLLIDYDVPV